MVYRCADCGDWAGPSHQRACIASDLCKFLCNYRTRSRPGSLDVHEYLSQEDGVGSYRKRLNVSSVDVHEYLAQEDDVGSSHQTCENSGSGQSDFAPRAVVTDEDGFDDRWFLERWFIWHFAHRDAVIAPASGVDDVYSDDWFLQRWLRCYLTW